MLLVNGAGGSAADPILAGLTAKFVFAASSMDIATVNAAFLDQAAGFPGTNNETAQLSPAAAVVLTGVGGSYDDTTDRLNIADTTGLSAGDPLYLSHASITDGVYLIATVVNATEVTIVSDPFAGGGNVASVAFQSGWGWTEVIGTAPIVSDAAGTQNFFKADVDDGSANNTQSQDSFYARNAPAGSAYIALDGGDFTGQTVPDTSLTLAVLGAWANNGGISHVELANHSGQAVNNFTWTNGGGVGEVALATAEGGLTAAAGDGAKYGRLLFKTVQGGASLGVDFDVVLDTAGPALVLTAFGA